MVGVMILRCFSKGFEGRKMEREAFVICEMFSNLLLKAGLGVSQEQEPGLARYKVSTQECLLNTCPLIWSKVQTLEPAWLVSHPTSTTYRKLGQITFLILLVYKIGIIMIPTS